MIAARGNVVACEPHRIVARILGARLDDSAVVRGTSAIVGAVDGERATLVPYGDTARLAPGDPVVLEEGGRRSVLGLALLGRAVDGLGAPLDGGQMPEGLRAPLGRRSIAPSQRTPLCEPLWTGLRAIDGLLTVVRGMRLGVFGPPGAGKSTLLSALARGIEADAVVIALIGERGTEARERIHQIDARATVVCAPSDRTAGERVAAGDLAMAQAAALARRGLHVALIFDSLARYVEAARDIALACGEAPGRGGYPAGVWPRLAALCEQAGAFGRGSITLIATVLSDAGDPGDPLSEAARAHLDGHVVLSRRRADRGAFPAIDVPASLSRPMPAAVSPEHLQAAQRVRAALARLEDSREARELGLAIAEPKLTAAVAAKDELEAFLRQGDERCAPGETLSRLERIADTV